MESRWIEDHQSRRCKKKVDEDFSSKQANQASLGALDQMGRGERDRRREATKC